MLIGFLAALVAAWTGKHVYEVIAGVTFVTGFLLGLCLTLVLLTWFSVRTTRARWTRELSLTRHVYRYVDEHLGARKFEGDRIATLRRNVGWFARDLARMLWPGSDMAGARALPPFWRQIRYVQLILEGRPARAGRWHLRDIAAVQVHWTSEAFSNQLNPQRDDWWRQLEHRVAAALGYKWREGMFKVDQDWEHSTATLRLRDVSDVPEHIGAEEDLLDDLAPETLE